MLFFGDTSPTFIIAFILVAVLAFAYHELGHALVADRLGDPTPRQHGRMTLNPFPHLSLVGLLMLILIGFGWAVTPINPRLMRGNPRVSHAIVAAAGPAMNLLMAVLFAIPLRFLLPTYMLGVNPIPALDAPMAELVMTFLHLGVYINLLLIAFNLMPIPPLDGFWLLRGILPAELAYLILDPLMRFGTIILLLVVFILPQFGLSIFAAFNGFIDPVYAFLVGV